MSSFSVLIKYFLGKHLMIEGNPQDTQLKKDNHQRKHEECSHCRITHFFFAFFLDFLEYTSNICMIKMSQ